MIFLIRIWSSKSFWIFYIYVVVIGTILGGIIGFLGSKGLFDKPYKKAIGEKYCYFSAKNNLVKPYSDVMITSDEDKAKEVLRFYNQSRDTHTCLSISIDGEKIDGEVSAFNKVEVLGYIKDSSIVQIRVHWPTRTNPDNKHVGFVPLFTLHDTLPKDTTRK